MIAYLSKQTQHKCIWLLQINTKHVTVMSTSAAAAGNNDTVVNSIAQKLVAVARLKQKD